MGFAMNIRPALGSEAAALSELVIAIGRELLNHALARAAQGGASEVTVDADPNAESFYLACGGTRRGEVPAPIPGQPERVRPQLEFVQFNNAIRKEVDAAATPQLRVL